MLRTKFVTTLVVCALGLTGAMAAEPTLDNDDKKTLYALGVALSQRLVEFNLSEEESRLVTAGLADGILGADPRVEMDVYGPKLEAYLGSRALQQAGVEEEAGKAFREKLAQESGAVTTDSGLVYIEMKSGDGKSPGASDKVTVHYHGTLRDGTVFDSSVEGDREPVEFALNQVIPCFSEGIQKMKVGGKSRLVCPAAIAYGNRGAPPQIRPGATLSFEVDLISVADAAATPAAATPSP